MKGARALVRAGVAVLALAAPASADRPGFAEAMAALAAGDATRGVAIFADLASAGDRQAQLNLAVLTARGTGIPQNDLDAAYWAWRARLAGLPEALAPSDALVARLAPEAVATLAERLAADMEALAAEGADWALLALARLELQLRPDPDMATAYEQATLAAALSVPGAAALRDALARDLDPATRLAAQGAATARFHGLCAGTARPGCPAVLDRPDA